MLIVYITNVFFLLLLGNAYLYVKLQIVHFFLKNQTETVWNRTEPNQTVWFHFGFGFKTAPNQTAKIFGFGFGFTQNRTEPNRAHP